MELIKEKREETKLNCEKHRQYWVLTVESPILVLFRMLGYLIGTAEI